MRLHWIFLPAILLVACSDTLTPAKPGAVAAKPEQKKHVQTKKAEPKTGVAEKKKPKPVQPAVSAGEITGIQMGQLFTMMQSGKIHLVDVRPQIFYRLGHIDGAVNFPLNKYGSAFPVQEPAIKQAIASGKTVVLYCQNLKCPDAYKTALKLVKHGHSVSIYKGGWEEWKKSGL